MTVTSLSDTLGRAICKETCAYKGEPPCYTIDQNWPPATCDEPGCKALGQAAAAVAFPPRVRDAKILAIEMRIFAGTEMHSTSRLLDTKHALLPGFGSTAEGLAMALGMTMENIKHDVVAYAAAGKMK